MRQPKASTFIQQQNEGEKWIQIRVFQLGAAHFNAHTYTFLCRIFPELYGETFAAHEFLKLFLFRKENINFAMCMHLFG